MKNIVSDWIGQLSRHWQYLTMNGKSKIIFLTLIGVVFCGARLKKSCPNLKKTKWPKKVQLALMNLIHDQQTIPAYMRRCLPEVTDFSCKRLSKRKEGCLAFISNHETYEGESFFSLTIIEFYSKEIWKWQRRKIETNTVSWHSLEEATICQLLKIPEKRDLGISERFALKIFGTSGLNGLLVGDEPRFKNGGNSQNIFDFMSS